MLSQVLANPQAIEEVLHILLGNEHLIILTDLHTGPTIHGSKPRGGRSAKQLVGPASIKDQPLFLILFGDHKNPDL